VVELPSKTQIAIEIIVLVFAIVGFIKAVSDVFCDYKRGEYPNDNKINKVKPKIGQAIKSIFRRTRSRPEKPD
jgi:hypothetical protein